MRKWLVLLALLASPVHAEDLWLTATTVSHHVDRSAHYNERNPGLGLEYRFDQDASVFVSRTLNSYSNWSTYLGVEILPIQVRQFRLGLTMFLATGYPDGTILLAAPAVAWEGDRFGANFLVVPGAYAALQLKVKF